jgi:hypothetical protein
MTYVKWLTEGRINKTRHITATGFAILAAIPAVFLLLAMACIGIITMALFIPALLIAPKYELTFGSQGLHPITPVKEEE